MNKGILAGLGPGDGPDVASGDVGQSAIVMAGSRKEVAFSTTVDKAVAVTDCSNYRWVSVHFTTFGGGSATFQGSNDNSSWVTVYLSREDAESSPANSGLSTGSNNHIFYGALNFRYFRVNVTSITGTVAGTAQFFAAPGLGRSMITTTNGAAQLVSNVSSSDALANASSFQLNVAPLLWNGATWDRPRTATKFATVEATASGDTTVATPTSGKKIRVLGYSIEVTQDAASAGGADVIAALRDATTPLGYAATIFCPAAAGATFGPGYSSGWRTVNNGQLSAAANNVLNINLSAALTAGKCRVNVAYCEE